MATNTFSGNSYPQQVRSGEGQNEFTLPLDNPDPKKQVVGEENANRLYMPGRLRQYIPTLYKQVWLNTRAILSVNGYEIVENQPILDDADQQIGRKTTLLSDIRTSVLRSTNGDFKATTSELKEYEVGMTKLVISDGDDTTGAPRTLDAYTSGSTKYYFMVHNGELYDQYTFLEKGGHIEYVQAKNAAGDVIYIVLSYEGYFANKDKIGKQKVADQDYPEPEPEPSPEPEPEPESA